MAAAKKQCFLRFLYLTESSPPSFKVRGLQMTTNLAGASFHLNLWGGPGAVPPAGVQGAEPLGGGQGAKPPEAPAFLAF